MKNSRTPKYRRQRRDDGNDSAFVVLNDQRHYLGVYNSPESKQAYHYVNEQAARLRRMFKWAVSQELLPATVFQALMAVDGLRRGRSEARETEPVRPVPDAYVDGTKPHVSRQVWALVQLQLLTGARPGELLRLRPVDLDTTGTVWLYLINLVNSGQEPLTQ